MFAAFKALPLELARIRRTSSSGGAYAEPAAEVNEAKNCKEVVDTIAEAIHRACSDIGNCADDFVTDEDVVG
jgi:phosphatidylinositol 4-phosphatase